MNKKKSKVTKLERLNTSVDLYDLYKNLLTPKQQNIYEEFFNEDLNLTEIARNNSITKQAVRDTIKIIETSLQTYESKIGFLKYIKKNNNGK